MKPLLPAPYTPEDEAILFRHGRGRWATTLRASGLQADIRDAQLIYRAQRVPTVALFLRPEPSVQGLPYLVLVRLHDAQLGVLIAQDITCCA